MTKHERIVMIFAGIVAVLFVVIILRWRDSYERGRGERDQMSSLSYRAGVSKEGRRGVGDRKKRTRKGYKKKAKSDSAVIDRIARSFVTESVNRDNVQKKAVWNKTNRSGVHMVSITMKEKPYPGTLLVWTGDGILPFNSYRVKGRSLNVIMTQTKNDFLSANNFINIRYIADLN